MASQKNVKLFFTKELFRIEFNMRKWYRKLKLEKKGKIGPLQKEEKLELKNKLKKYLKYVDLLLLRRHTISYPKKYAKVGSILI